MMHYSSTSLCTLQLKEGLNHTDQSRNNYCPRAVSIEIHDIHAVLT